ncbi:response regulator [bacterium]|nr:response regulator [bacterium]MCI0680192.1 response regulator [bacterium]
MEENKKQDVKSVLIVEDENIILGLLEKKIAGAGYHVSVAHDGEEAMRKIKEEKPDLVLLDMILPKKDGFEILKDLHDGGTLPDLPIIVISNSGQRIEIDRMMGYGVRDYLIKINFNPSDVLEKVKTVFAKEESRGAAA